MTLFFDINKLEKEADGNDLKFMQILEDHYIVRTKHTLPKLKYKPINGKSWLLNPQPLFNKHIADIAYIVQYVKLAGRRDYLLYKLYNQISLDRSYYPTLNIDNISRNPLLFITQTHVHFKYETIYLNSRKK